MLPKESNLSFEEFLVLDQKNSDMNEFINGSIYVQASPSTLHQRISRNLSTMFDIYLNDTECELFTAPFDIILKGAHHTEKNKVIPDISIIYDKSGLNNKNYIGVPTLIIEILSPSTAWIDISKKFELYQRYQVKEYWIVSPRNKNIQIFNLNDQEFYGEPIVYYNDDICKSNIFHNLNISLKDVFE